LTEQRALQVAGAMLQKGHSVFIEAEPSPRTARITAIPQVWPFSRTFPRRLR
jgi:hypothetical protein